MELNKVSYEWYAVYTQVFKEKKVQDYLGRLGIECYLPLRKILRQWSDRKVWIEEPLFPRYIFVKVSHYEYFDVFAVPGVISYVMFGGKAQPVSSRQIEGIRTMVCQQEREVFVSHANIGKGQFAEIMCGPLKGITGEVVRISSDYHIVIRIDTLGCHVFTNVSAEELRILPVAPLSRPLSAVKNHQRPLS
ncbi:transcription antitermination factor NusG [Bacteroidales bacterium 6E]|nr:transcription antitermination factor NusG [Bacteroidales bacterium 6E]